MHQDYLDLLQCLNVNRVKYLIIGGYAVINYTEPRYTKDLDIWIEASLPNARKVLKALAEFGAPVDNLTVEELAKPGLIFIFGIPPLRVDIINKASGSTFKTAWGKKNKIKLGATFAHIVSRDVLIKLKRASGRPQDLADLDKLKRVKP